VRAWYCPSWHGDLRLEPEGRDRTRLSIVKPTPAELSQLASMAKPLQEKGWIDVNTRDLLAMKKPKLFIGRGKVIIDAPIEDVGPLVTSIMQPGPTVITAVRFKDGHTEVVQTSKPVPATEVDTYREPASERKSPLPEPSKPEPKKLPKSEPTEEARTLAKRPDAEAAATVKRATPCCPDCYVDAVGPATEVLLSFLDEEQHEMWSKERYVIVRGGLSDHRYIIAHRHTARARDQGRCTYDLDDRATMHFHDWTVPPEEEVLGAMLVLRHREPWLRNEATTFFRTDVRFKNPFGDGGDGVIDTRFTRQFGHGLINGFMNGLKGK
jgi:hypothetical protein